MNIRKDLLLISCAYVLAHFVTTLTGGYGYFRDELYYIACSKHLDWGYVDQPPFSILMLFLNRAIFGDSLFALRLLPAVCGGALVFITGLIAVEMGGDRFARILAAVSAAVAPVYLAIFNFYSMNSFDLLFWALAFYIVLRVLNTSNEKLWILFGVVIGIAMQNKISILFFCIGLGIGLTLSPHRRQLISKWFWFGAAVAIVINVPHVLWQMKHQWPTLEFMRNATELKNAQISPAEFLGNVMLLMHPFNAIVWLAGLVGLLLSSKLQPYRFLFYSFGAIAAIFLQQNGKPYYLAPFFPALFAAGGVVIEQFTSVRLRIVRPVLVCILILGGLIVAPLTLPILPVETYIRYANALGLKPRSEERDRPGKLSQHFADMFGWKELAQDVAEVYKRLPAEERADCAIYASNYGQAGAIDFFGPKYGLPAAMSGHNSYWIWGPGNASGQVVIIIGGELEEHQPFYESCAQEAVHQNEYARSFETDLPIFVCRHLKQPIAEVWPQTREFI